MESEFGLSVFLGLVFPVRKEGVGAHLRAGKSLPDVVSGVEVFAAAGPLLLVFGVDGAAEIAVTVAEAEMAGAAFGSFPSLGSLDSLHSLPSFESRGSFFLAERLFFGGAFDAQPWQYHLPRGTLIIGGM